MISAALVEARLFELDFVVRSALWATRLSVCPTRRYHESVAVLEVREMNDCLSYGSWESHAVKIASKLRSVKYIITHFLITKCDLKKSCQKKHTIRALRLHRSRHLDAFGRPEERPRRRGQ